jgi:hypothetical protein
VFLRSVEEVPLVVAHLGPPIERLAARRQFIGLRTVVVSQASCD